MISGFSQLHCGISTYHWQRVVNTAWFACVTHLSCLTFLRDHLLHNRITQLWRIPGMVALTTMIIYALTTTSRYDWQSYNYSGMNLVTPFDQAVCYLNPSFDAQIPDDQVRRQRIVISIVFLGLGMINRIRRLCYTPNFIVNTIRKTVSDRTRRCLMYCYGQGSADSLTACIAAVLVYRPLLAVFLMVRLLMDGLTSMAFEVSRNITMKARTDTDSKGLLVDNCLHMGQP
jgi:hypothetical protein